MSVYVETNSHLRQIAFSAQHREELIAQIEFSHISEQVAALMENPLMKKEVTERNYDKINDALKVLNAIYSSDFLNEYPTSDDLKALLEYLERARAQLENGVDANGKIVSGFNLEGFDSKRLREIMFEVFSNLSAEEKQAMVNHASTFQIAPDPVEDTGVSADRDIVDNLNDFIEELTDVYLKRYQDAASASTNIYTAFAELNIAISEMISRAEVDAEKNTIQLDVTVLREAIADLKVKLFESGEIVDQLSNIKFPIEMKEMAEELAQGAGLVLQGGPPAEFYTLAVDPSAFNNIEKAFAALTDSANVVGGNPNVIKVPSGTLQGFQTAVESVNNTVSTDNQTLIERLRSVTNQQQQTTQLFSSLLKEIIEANKGFITKISS